MSSRTSLDKPLRLVFSTKATKKSPIRWSRKADSRNICIGQNMRGDFPGVGMATPGNAKGQAFTSAVRACPGSGRTRSRRGGRRGAAAGT